MTGSAPSPGNASAHPRVPAFVQPEVSRITHRDARFARPARPFGLSLPVARPAEVRARLHTRSVPFLSIEFNLEALRKLAGRAISVDEVTEVFRASPIVWIENPNPRTEHSRWVIGPARAGRFLTIVVDRDAIDHGRWHVMTAWDSTEAQIRLYRKVR